MGGNCCGAVPSYAPYGAGVGAPSPYLPQPGTIGYTTPGVGPVVVPGTVPTATPIPTAPLPTALTPPGGLGYGLNQPYPYHPPRSGCC